MKAPKAVVIAFFVLMSAISAWPQYQGKIGGRVLDPGGQPVEKAEVSIVSQKSSALRYDVKTDKEGRFIQVGIMPGYYMVSVKKSGFTSMGIGCRPDPLTPRTKSGHGFCSK